MVRTAETAKISSGRPKKTTNGPTGGISQSSSSSDKGGGNPVCPRETPSWQKPITNFFGKVPKEKHPEVTKDGNKRMIHSGDEVEVVNEPQMEVDITASVAEEPGCSASSKANTDAPNSMELDEEENITNFDEKENMINNTNEAEIEEKDDHNKSNTPKKRKMNYESFEQYENTSKELAHLAKKHKSSKTK